jgi:hypothetical protein
MNSNITRIGDFVGSGNGAGILIGASLLIIYGLRAVLFPGLGGDEGEQLIFAQYFDWGYQPRNPPLFTWLTIAASEIVGPNRFAVLTVKVSALGLSYYFLWKSASAILKDARLAALAVLSPFALYYVTWDSVFGYSHSLLVTSFYMAALWLLIRISEKPNLINFCLFGIIIAGGLLSKYAYALFVTALLGAAAFDAHLRQKLFRPALIVSLIIAALITAPHFIWLIEHLPTASTAAPWSFNGKGLIKLFIAIFGFMSPLWLILMLLFPAMIKPSRATDEDDKRWLGALETYFIILLTLSVLIILTTTVDRLRTHYMFILIPMILYLFLRIKITAPALNRLRLLGSVFAILSITVAAGLVIKLMGEPIKCKRCQHHIPYTDVAEELRSTGFTGGTIFAYWHPDPIAGNLSEQFPTSRVISAKHINVQPPALPTKGQCLLIWPDAGSPVGRLSTIDMANRHLGTSIESDISFATVNVPLKMGSGKQTSFGIILLTPGQGSCE